MVEASCGAKKITCEEKRGKRVKMKNKRYLTCRRLDKS